MQSEGVRRRVGVNRPEKPVEIPVLNLSDDAELEKKALREKRVILWGGAFLWIALVYSVLQYLKFPFKLYRIETLVLFALPLAIYAAVFNVLERYINSDQYES